MQSNIKAMMEAAGVPMDSPKVKKLMELEDHTSIALTLDDEDNLTVAYDSELGYLEQYARCRGWDKSVNAMLDMIQQTDLPPDVKQQYSTKVRDFERKLKSQYQDNDVSFFADEFAAIIIRHR